MLEYFYKWLCERFAVTGVEGYQQGYILILNFWDGKPRYPLSLSYLQDEIKDLTSRDARLLNSLIKEFIGGVYEFNLTDRNFDCKYSHRVARVKFTLDDMVVIEYV